MMSRLIFLTPLLLAFCLLPCSCTLFVASHSGSESVVNEFDESSGNAFEFVVKATHGLIQVRESYDAPWRFLKKGETLSPEYSVRTGFNSHADLVMVEKGRTLDVELSSLLPEIELYDLYDKLLSEAAYGKYILGRCEKKGECATKLPVLVSGSTLQPFEMSDFLAASAVNLEMKNQQAGRASAIGGASAGASGGGGGC